MPIIKFNQGYGQYNAGESASFSPEEAARIVGDVRNGARIAEYADKPAARPKRVVPKLQNVLDAGYEPSVAVSIVASEQALYDGKTEAEAASGCSAMYAARAASAASSASASVLPS